MNTEPVTSPPQKQKCPLGPKSQNLRAGEFLDLLLDKTLLVTEAVKVPYFFPPPSPLINGKHGELPISSLSI